ncbi:DUF4402 domain-containing protein [Pseudoalteromonas luteoviolacea]|uniref:DUF4402 domain-containing protein n=1 Tax=Pseudoalteromonas luteoviolacea NCIMB 1942 TaxID=1365253 RepID=A0A162A851_9GAMM|nr:DUF4402 domain-containing protein [Pseudoalteromonas luteoviolacea]KZN45663.1 hypothetical protein N482_14030 [Pseudoalteromonas luteoviolacea NCIMB 1942]KZX00451.1 hypothetical protein JL49_11170 [Pseudoalteromonas luteoviolacea]
MKHAIRKGSFNTLAAFIALLVAPSFYSYASVVVERPLNFGTVLISNHAEVGRVQMRANGQSTTNGPVHLVSGAHTASIVLSALPAQTNIAISTNIITPQMSHSNLAISGINLIHLEHVDRVYSDTLGNAQFEVGGTIEIKSSPSQYPDGTYRVWASIEVSY